MVGHARAMRNRARVAIGRRGSMDQTIWIVVAMIIAVAVGAIMMRMIDKSRQVESLSGEDRFSPAAETFCAEWFQPAQEPRPREYAPSQAALEKSTDTFRGIGWLSAQKNTVSKAYIEPGPVTGCDCTVFLASTAGHSRLGESPAAGLLRSESGSGSSYSPEACHRRAACVARSLPALAVFFEERTC